MPFITTLNGPLGEFFSIPTILGSSGLEVIVPQRGLPFAKGLSRNSIKYKALAAN